MIRGERSTPEHPSLIIRTITVLSVSYECNIHVHTSIYVNAIFQPAVRKLLVRVVIRVCIT